MPSTAPSTTARVGPDLLPPRRRGRPPKTSSLRERIRQLAAAGEDVAAPAETESDQGRPIVVRRGFPVGRCRLRHPRRCCNSAPMVPPPTMTWSLCRSIHPRSGWPIRNHHLTKCAVGHPGSQDLRGQAVGNVASSGTAGFTVTGPLGACAICVVGQASLSPLAPPVAANGASTGFISSEASRREPVRVSKVFCYTP